MTSVLSKEPEAKSLPLLENLTHETARVWLVRIFLRRYGLCGGDAWLDMVVGKEKKPTVHTNQNTWNIRVLKTVSVCSQFHESIEDERRLRFSPLREFGNV